MQKRDFLLMLKRLQLIDPVHLTAAKIIALLADEDPNIRPTNTDIRLDIEVGLFCFSCSNSKIVAFLLSMRRCVSWNSSKH